MDKQYIIFDFDNTLVNSLDYWAKTEFKQLFKIYGKKPDKNFKKLKSGTSNAQAAQIFIDLAKVDITVEEVFEKTATIMLGYYTHNVKFIKGAKQYLLDLKNQGKTLVLASATQMPLLEKVIAHFKLDMFDKVYSESTLGIGKNDTKFFETILKDLDTTAENVFLFEDSCTSIKNATKNGIQCCGIVHKYNKKSKKTMQDICKLIIKNYHNKQLKQLGL